MSLPEVQCCGTITASGITVYKECVISRKIFDECVMRECVDGIEFAVDGNPTFSGTIQPLLIMRNCIITNQQIIDASTAYEKRLRFIGRCCCQVFAKDNQNNIIRLNVTSIPSGTNLSIGPSGELCFNFNIRRSYPNASRADFHRLLHFIDQQSFELRCLSEGIIDEENNQFNDGVLLTNFGVFVVIKFSTEVQLCMPVFGYCQVTDECTDDDFCDNFAAQNIPNFNAPQLNIQVPVSS